MSRSRNLFDPGPPPDQTGGGPIRIERGGGREAMNRLARWLDNPIFVKHRRSRLRRGQFLPSLAVVMTLALCAVVIGYQWDGLRGGGTFGALMALQATILGFMGASQVGSSVNRARDSGVFEFHRVSPLPPWDLAFGFFFGAPVREYLLFASTLPFSLVCVAAGRPSVFGFFQLMVPLLLGAWLLHAVALLNSLLWKPSKSSARGVIGLVLFLVFGGGTMISAFAGAATTVDEAPTLNFFSLQLPWLVTLAIETLPAIGFLMLASARKIASERAPALSKPQAIACLASGSTLLLGLAWNIPEFGYWTLAVLYATIFGALILAIPATPGSAEYSKGVLGASREGRAHPSAWSDRGLNRLTIVAFALVTLVVPTVAWYAVDAQAPVTPFRPPMLSYSLPIAIGVFVVAYFGLALQYFQLRFARRAGALMGLFVFLTWILPLPLGAISAAGHARNAAPGDGPDTVSAVLASLSPVAGIALSSGVAELPGHQAVQMAALLPAIGFAFLFNNLVISVRRRIEKMILEATPKPARPDPDFEPAEKQEPILLG